MAHQVVVGYETNYVREISDVLNLASACEFEFLALPLYHPRYRRDVRLLKAPRTGPSTRSDMVLSSSEWISNVVSKLPEVVHSPPLDRTSPIIVMSC